MEDKDYSGCRYYRKDKSGICDIGSINGVECFCNDINNCYYKQLQGCQKQLVTKMDECEELRDNISKINMDNNNLDEAISRLSAKFNKIECDNIKLKADIISLRAAKNFAETKLYEIEATDTIERQLWEVL